jgi:hypothetical protein
MQQVLNYSVEIKKKNTLEIPLCHDIVTTETSKSIKPKFLRRHESIWNTRNKKLMKMSLELYPKIRKQVRTVSGDSLCHLI